MDFIDTHAHLYAEEFDSDRSEMLQRCIKANVTKMILPNIDSGSIEGLQKLRTGFPANCFAMMGLHPCSVTKTYSEELEKIRLSLFSGYKYVAVGEIGIDLYWDKTLNNEQEEVFTTQCKWAIELNLPIVIHTRNATAETISCLKQLPEQPGGVFHCFSGTHEEAIEITELGYSLGIGGIVTYKNGTLPHFLGNIDLKHILLETDSPYLPPVPFRGKRNESSYIPYIAEKLADVYNVSIYKIAEITTENAERLFDLK